MAQVLLENVTKNYGKLEVVHGINLDIAHNEFVVLVGPSGCGKSTTLRMIAGLEDISAGDISIGGQIVNDMPPRDRNISMVFQNYALYPHMTVRENLGFSLQIAGKPPADISRAVNEAAGILSLNDYLDRKPRDPVTVRDLDKGRLLAVKRLNRIGASNHGLQINHKNIDRYNTCHLLYLRVFWVFASNRWHCAKSR